MKKTILAFTLLFAFGAHAQYVFDHGYNLLNTAGNSPVFIAPSVYSPKGQDFKPFGNGDLGRIEIYTEATTTCDSLRLKLYSGIGYGGSLLHNGVYTLGDYASATYRQLDIVPPVPVLAGNSYTFLIDTVFCSAMLSGPTIHYDEAGTYNDGTSLDGAGSPIPTRDLLFNIYMLDCSGFSTTPTVVDVSCNGMCDGSISLSTEGGTAPYTHTWLHGPVSSTLTGLCANTYTVEISDAAGCRDTFSYTVNTPLSLYTTITPTLSPCANTCEGSAGVVTVGGTAPFYYEWQPSGYTTDNLNNVLCPGQHTLTVTDANGCIYTNVTTISSPASLNVSAFVNASQCGLSTGSLSATISGGVTPYSLYWSTGDTINTVTNIPAGYYYLEVYDANGCYEYLNENVIDGNGPSVAVNSTTIPQCANDTTGSVDISVSGGTSPYSIFWSNGETTEDLINISGGYYDVYIYDAGNCFTSSTIVINAPAPFSYSSSLSLASCTNNDGSINLTATGGTAPLNYQWDLNTGNQTGPYAGALYADTYMCSITDANGCKDSVYISLDNSGGPVVVTDSVIKAGCSGGSLSSNGSLYISVTGNGPFTYLWSNGATTEDLNGVTTGFYDITVEDNNGCRSTHYEFVTGLIPGNPQICLVTVDTATQHNIIVWEKDVPGIMQYKVFRETNTEGQYNLIATIPADSLSVFEDTVANTASKAWKYEIQVTDSCGGVSYLSAAHQPIHLSVDSISGGVELIWSNYQGFTYNDYFIYRHHFSTGWVKVDSLPYGYNYYFDSNPPTPFDSLRYMIEVIPNNACTPTRGVINTTRSNIKTVNNARTNSISYSDKSKEIIVYPNPAGETLNIRFDSSEKYDISLYNDLGELVFEKKSANDSTLILNTSNYNGGVYTLKMNGENFFGNKRIIIVH